MFTPTAALSWFWIATLVNAFNFTDVCDGLLGSLSAVMLAGCALAYPASAPLALAVCGACIGFLAFNRPPATIFMGDAGSHLLGFLTAALTLGGTPLARTDPVLGLAQPILLAAVPLFELTFLTVVRIRKGLPWWKGSPDHFSLRLQAAGFSRAQTDAMACGAAAITAGVASLLAHVAPPAQAALLGLCSIGALVAAKVLLSWEVRPQAVEPSTASSETDRRATG